ncbi:MAG: type I secretion system permease/ATPase [Pseudomonadota bacterium]|nr:type I secretion system permease/ATPase [Pseudomonadota bacterium]
MINALALTGSLFMLQVYDRVIPSGSIPTLLALCLIVAVLYSYFGVMDYVRSRIFVRLGRKLEEALRVRVFDVMAFVTLRNVNGANGHGSQPVQDLTTVRQFISGQGPLAWFDMPFVPLYIAVLFLLHWVLGVVSVVAAVVILILALLTERAQRKPQAQATETSMRAQLLTEEARRNVEAMHSLGMKAAWRRRWEKVQGEALDQQTKANDAGASYAAFSRVFRLMLQSGMLAAAAWLAVKHEISSGSIVASSIILGRALAPIEQAVAGWPQFLLARKAYDRLANLLWLVPKERDRMELPAPKGILEVEKVVITLPGSDKPIVQGVGFQVKPGQGLGIIGPTGAGKSTLARALVGLIPLAQGSVRLDGATPDQRSSDDYGKAIGYLPQDVQIFAGTVAENIARFNDGVDASKVVEAAQLANIHDFVLRLPQGYDTQLGFGGARLSAGQRQRLALARALYGDPVLLVMDEPNSNLDAEGEVALDKAIRASLARGASVVVVAHRPSALVAMNDLLILADGRVAALGGRDEIMAKVGLKPPVSNGAPSAAPAALKPPQQMSGTSLSMKGHLGRPTPKRNVQ